MDWLIKHWDFLIGLCVIWASILNTCTKHFSEYKGAVKVLAFMSEMLSLVTSLGRINGRFGKLKLPGQSVK